MLLLPTLLAVIAMISAIHYYFVPTSSSAATLLLDGRLFLAAVGTVFNVAIVVLHWSTAPHPKFLMHLSRKLNIRAHMIFGTIEIGSSVWALLISRRLVPGDGHNLATFGKVQGMSAMLHALTALNQTSIVFGAKAIMHPAYYVCGSVHFYYGARTFLSPNSVDAIMDCYLVLNIFTWCRIYLAMMFRNNIAPGYEYTISIVLASVTICPAIMGPAGGVAVLVMFAVILEVTRFLHGIDAYHPKYLELLIERDRNKIIVDTTAHSKWRGIAKDTDPKTDLAAARTMFKSLDTDSSGFIEACEVIALAKSMHVAPAIMDAIVAAMAANDNKLDFDGFVRRIWRMPSFSVPKKSCLFAVMPMEQARIVFDTIDADGSGYIETHELSSLLVQWGCPDMEVIEYLKQYDTDGDGKFSFEEMFTQMRPIWRFGYGILRDSEIAAKRANRHATRDMRRRSLCKQQ